MKKLFIGVFAGLYLLASFGLAEIDFTQWPIEVRMFIAIALAALLIFFAAYNYLQGKNK